MSTRAKTYESVWRALSKDEAEAATMRLRADLMIALRDRIGAWAVTQTEAAKRLGISQPRLNDLLKGHIEDFRLDMLSRLASKAGLMIEMKVREAA
jgi:predicted XRE-type DNA-binding protein